MSSITNVVQEDYTARVEGTAREGEVFRQSVCCTERYDTSYLKKVPKAVVDADFGCGNPTKYLRRGDRVLDIGCGAGMNCYIAAQIVGRDGAVIGIDFTPSMLDVARGSLASFRESVPEAAPMRFVAASANDLALDLEWVDATLQSAPIQNQKMMQDHVARVRDKRISESAIPDASVDVVISNCVINLLDDVDKPSVFKEIARVLVPGGRFAISDNVSNIPVPDHVKANRVMWSACYAGVLQEQEFYAQLEAAGFVDIRIEVRNPDPAHAIDDLVFYSVTVTGVKPQAPAAHEKGAHVLYRGPFKGVVGESGKVYKRGVIETMADEDRMIAADPESCGFAITEGSTPQPAATIGKCCS
jgi:arsenite methyltransferase